MYIKRVDAINGINPQTVDKVHGIRRGFFCIYKAKKSVFTRL